LANGMTIDELNKEKSKTIDKAASAKQIWLKISVQNHYLYVIMITIRICYIWRIFPLQNYCYTTNNLHSTKSIEVDIFCLFIFLRASNVNYVFLYWH
jgi:hypothetical protein